MVFRRSQNPWLRVPGTSRGVRAALLHYLAVLHEQDFVGQGPDQADLVGGHDHGHPLLGQGPDYVNDLAHDLRVQGRCGFVQQQDFGIHGQGPGNGHPLLLPAGELCRVERLFICQAHLGQFAHGPFHGLGAPLVFDFAKGNGHIVQGREMVKEVEILKNHAHLLPVRVKGLFITDVHRLSFQPESAGVRDDQAVHALEQGAFTPAGRADEDLDLSLIQGEVNPLENLGAVKRFGNVFNPEYGSAHASIPLLE